MAMAKRSAIAALTVAMICSASWIAAQSSKGNPSNGQVVYEQHCLRCHGKNLDGQGPEARDLIVRPADLSSPQSRAKTDWELLITISHGSTFTPMHGWRERLSQDQIMDVLSYIRMMAPFDAVS
jgi:cytochrome c oxidase cbb3-type subunit 3